MVAGILSALFVAQGIAIASAQEEIGVLVQQWGPESVNGPVWVGVDCQDVSCPDLELEISADGFNYTVSDLHRLEWSGYVSSNVSWTLSYRNSSDISIETIYPFWTLSSTSLEISVLGQTGIVEEVDLPNLVPTSKGDYDSIGSVIFVGALENSSDKDSIHISGNPGDVILLDYLTGPATMEMEFWNIGDDGKALFESVPDYELSARLLEYPAEGELWIRITHDGLEGYHPYEFSVKRYNSSSEGPNGGELSNPWSNGAPHLFTWGEHISSGSMGDRSAISTFKGHIAASDTEGDSLLIGVGAGVLLNVECSFSEETNVEIFLQEHGGNEVNVSNNQGSCPESLLTTKMTNDIEFRLTSESTASWVISVETENYGDSPGVGDAPDHLWGSEGPDERWPEIGLNIELFGSLGPGDSVDVYAISILSDNLHPCPVDAIAVCLDADGVMIRVSELFDTQSQVKYQILSLNQTDWSIQNSSNGSLINLPFGTHALRIEGTVSGEEVLHYRFSLPNLGTTFEDDAEFEDLSELFSDYYLLVGFLMLLPLLVVLWWNRGRVLGQQSGEIEIERHEMRRLRRLRERLVKVTSTEELDEGIIESALIQLGDSAWEGVVSDWGEPLITHYTGQMDFCAWRMGSGSGTMLIGIRVGSEPWNLAAIRVHSPEGSAVAIDGVYPKHLFQEDEIYLDELAAGSITFLRVQIAGDPSVIGFHLSGIVGGDPVAAVPIRSIVWSEEE